jgi:hypothetical protein
VDDRGQMDTGPVVFLLSTVEDRIGLAEKFMQSVRRYRPDWPVYVVAQSYSEASVRVMRRYGPQMRQLPHRLGPHVSKMIGLTWIRSEHTNVTICSVDDDMELTDRTNYDPILEFVRRPHVGLVSAGWAPHETRAATWPLVNAFVPQPIVYTGGGLFLTERIAAVLANTVPATTDYWSDNCQWSLATYLAGYENYRYRGSVTIHRVCRNGGRKAWINERQRTMPDPAYLTMQPGVKPGEWHIGDSSGLTALAKETHRAARERLG